MEAIGNHLRYFMVDFWAKHGDRRSSDYFMIRNGLYGPLPILLVYFLFVTQIGPRLMRNRQPFNLKKTLLCYNSFMVILNFHFFIETLRNFNYGLDIFDFDYPPKDDMRPITLKKVGMANVYLISKFLDLCDTFFFVLRKKDKQITKLHLYHHISVPLLGWVAFRFVPFNNPLAIFAIGNTLMHTVMYAYYAMAALGPEVRPYLWWKKYITQLQMAQFAIYGAFAVVFALRQRGYPAWQQILAYAQPVLYLVLFWNYYVKEYTVKRTN